MRPQICPKSVTIGATTAIAAVQDDAPSMYDVMAQFPVLNPDFLENLSLIATDMDGTLTQSGKFTPDLLQALERLAAAAVPVLIVTGRSAGWVDAIAHYLPIAGAIAENGGLFYRPSATQDTVDPEFLVPISNILAHRQQLAGMFQRLRVEFPQLQEAADNRFRLTDWTFDVAGLSDAVLDQIRDRCHATGWGFTYSTVQCHIKLLEQEKSAGLLHVIHQHFPGLTPDQVVTVGDSPNDESLFNPKDFPRSVGVANIRHYWDRLSHRPSQVTAAAEAAGFCELAQMICQTRRSA